MQLSDRFLRVKYRTDESRPEQEGWLYQISDAGTMWRTIILTDEGKFELSRMPWTRAVMPASSSQ